MVDAVDGIERVRYTSPHPKDMREDVIRAHAELPSLCEHIHLPLQSGSSRVLKAMKRTYNRERYLDRVAMIREMVPDCAISTDIIVGFPGETGAEFEETMEVVEQVRYDSAFTFNYSPRRGTAAAELDGQVPHEVKRERMGRLVEAVQRISTERAQRFVGRTMERARRGPVAHRPVEAARPHPPQQDRELHGPRPARRAGRRGDRRRHQHHAGGRRAAAISRCLSRLVAIFGPTGVGKTAVALALADALRQRGEDPVAISADALQVYRGLETLTGVATAPTSGLASTTAW